MNPRHALNNGILLRVKASSLLIFRAKNVEWSGIQEIILSSSQKISDKTIPVRTCLAQVANWQDQTKHAKCMYGTAPYNAASCANKTCEFFMRILFSHL